MRFALAFVSQYCFGRALRDGGRLAAILDSFGGVLCRIAFTRRVRRIATAPPFLEVLEVYDLARVGTRSIVSAVFTFH